MAYTTINKSTDNFNTKLWTGNGGTQSLTGVGFQPDWTWIKGRSWTYSHGLYDAVRGATKVISSESSNGETTNSTGLTAFNSDGFSVGNHDDVNGNNNTYASWNWKANGQGSANTDGTINSTVSVNQTAGFSIVKYTGNPSSSATIGHGLGVTPSMIIAKSLISTDNWVVYHKDLGASAWIELDNTDAKSTAGSVYRWNDTAPTNTVFSVGAGSGTNNTSQIAYCFAEKAGYSKFGSFVGNASTDGSFCYLGFKPSFVILKNVSTTGNWWILDNKRNSYNVTGARLQANSNGAESSYSDVVDFTSNGFKLRGTYGDINGSGNTIIYMAFGQSLVGSNNVPCTAR